MAGVDLIELMKGVRVVILIDAARSGQTPGTIHRLDASDNPISNQLFPRSSHAIGTVDALELARTIESSRLELSSTGSKQAIWRQARCCRPLWPGRWMKS